MIANQSLRLNDNSEDFDWNDSEIVKMFAAAASTFVKHIDGWTQIWAASRDWFLEEWGRDTFISLPGILLVTGRYDEAKSVFRHFAQYMQNGLVPNRIQEGEMLFNTVDGSMWFIQALKNYVEYTEDWEFVAEMMPSVLEIITAYRNGTSYERNGMFEIKMDDDGLIISPSQATWMDADPSGVGDAIVTPRNGKAVEINALWYANLVWVGEVVGRCHPERACPEQGRRARRMAPCTSPTSQSCFARPQHDTQGLFGSSKLSKDLKVLAKKVKKSFNKKFWNEDERCLFDVIEGDPHSSAIRPNQIIAVSHGGNLLTQKKKKLVFDSITKDLLTLGGLRTLSPRDSHYRGTYNTSAPMSEKDFAYHQGTIWPWLVGPYCDALVAIRKSQKKSGAAIKKELKTTLTPLVQFCMDSEYASLPEVFSGDAPYEPGGTTSQAWSVAEVFRIICEQKLVKKS